MFVCFSTSSDRSSSFSFFFFNDTATTEIYTLSLHDALPIYTAPHGLEGAAHWQAEADGRAGQSLRDDPRRSGRARPLRRSEEHTSELQSQSNLVCRLLLEKKKKERSEID